MEALLVVDEEEKAEAIDKRERHDELDEEVAAELAVLVDMKDEAVEVRPGVGEHMHKRGGGAKQTTYANRWLVRTCAGSDGAGVLPAGPRYVASTPLVCRDCRPWLAEWPGGQGRVEQSVGLGAGSYGDMPIEPRATTRASKRLWACEERGTEAQGGEEEVVVVGEGSRWECL